MENNECLALQVACNHYCTVNYKDNYLDTYDTFLFIYHGLIVREKCYNMPHKDRSTINNLDLFMLCCDSVCSTRNSIDLFILWCDLLFHRNNGDHVTNLFTNNGCHVIVLCDSACDRSNGGHVTFTNTTTTTWPVPCGLA